MSKVIHLSDEAHSKAKVYCREHGLKMSDWVAGLIDTAIAMAIAGGEPASLGVTDDNVRALVQKKKLLEQFEDKPQTADDGLPAYAAPPFWANGVGS